MRLMSPAKFNPFQPFNRLGRTNCVYAIDPNTIRFYMTHSFLQKFLGSPFAPEIAVDLLQCFPANCL